MSEPQGSTGVPYLGSKISLISKAEIRYEGTLYTIDPREATVALAKVRSFGTEDRPTDRPVAARDEVFEFIIFRGQDIKDLNVCEPPQPQPTEGVPLDPAIVRSSQPPSSPAGAPYAATSPGQPPGLQYQPPIQPLQFEQQTEYSVQPSHAQHHQPTSQGHHHHPPPSQGQHQPPTSEGQHHPPTSQGQHHPPTSHGQHHQPPGLTKEPSQKGSHSIEQGNNVAPPVAAYAARPVASSQISTQQPYSAKGSSNHNAQDRPASPENAPHGRQRNNQQHPHQQQYPQQQHHQQQHQPYQGQGTRRGYHQNNNGENRGRDERGPQASYARERNGNNRVLIRGGPHRGGQWGAAPGGHHGGRMAEPLKFDTEFDFESSNAQFAKDSIDQELKNLSLGDKPVTVPVSGDKEEEEVEDEAFDSEVVEEDPVYYDKKKSFFDNISCDATEASKGQRFSWHEGRKLNSETFGTRENFRRNYRGRGNWRGGADHSGWGGGGQGGGGGRWRGEGGYSDGGWYNRGRGGFNREGGGRYYGGNAGANGQGRRNWGYDDRGQKDGHPRIEVRS